MSASMVDRSGSGSPPKGSGSTVSILAGAARCPTQLPRHRPACRGDVFRSARGNAVHHAGSAEAHLTADRPRCPGRGSSGVQQAIPSAARLRPGSLRSAFPLQGRPAPWPPNHSPEHLDGPNGRRAPTEVTAMVNRVILDGHCTRDTVRVATQGKPMARMRVATNSVWRDANGDRQETTEYHSIVLFARTAA